MPSKKKGTKAKKITTHSNKNKNTVIVNVNSDKQVPTRKGVRSFTKGNSYLGGTGMRGFAYPSPTVINNIQPAPMLFPQMDINRLNAIENSINNIGSDVQALHGRINKPSNDEVKPYIPSSIESMRTQLASAAQSRISSVETPQHMRTQISHVLPHALPMSIDTPQPLPMSVDTTQLSSHVSFGGSGDSGDSDGGGGGGGGNPPNTPSVQTASTPARTIDMVRLDRDNSTTSSASRVSNPSVDFMGEKLGKIKTKKEESEGSFDSPKSVDDILLIEGATPVVAQSFEEMVQSSLPSVNKRRVQLTESPSTVNASISGQQRSRQLTESPTTVNANIFSEEYDDMIKFQQDLAAYNYIRDKQGHDDDDINNEIYTMYSKYNKGHKSRKMTKAIQFLSKRFAVSSSS